ncbi:hypothetical protein FLA_5557 [Filimonas lacunae]|nr:hypothetical protein FLA_5557 [Filimonas lacunae]
MHVVHVYIYYSYVSINGCQQPALLTDLTAHFPIFFLLFNRSS